MQRPIAADFASQLSIRFRERNGAFEIAPLATTAIARLRLRASAQCPDSDGPSLHLGQDRDPIATLVDIHTCHI